jgi:hypothetical protein
LANDEKAELKEISNGNLAAGILKEKLIWAAAVQQIWFLEK